MGKTGIHDLIDSPLHTSFKTKDGVLSKQQKLSTYCTFQGFYTFLLTSGIPFEVNSADLQLHKLLNFVPMKMFMNALLCANETSNFRFEIIQISHHYSNAQLGLDTSRVCS